MFDRPANAARAHTATEFTSVSRCLPAERVQSHRSNEFSQLLFFATPGLYICRLIARLLSLSLLLTTRCIFGERIFFWLLVIRRKFISFRTHGLRSTRDDRGIGVMHFSASKFCVFFFFIDMFFLGKFEKCLM